MLNAMLLESLRDSVRAYARGDVCVCALGGESERFCACVGMQEAMFVCVRLEKTG